MCSLQMPTTSGFQESELLIRHLILIDALSQSRVEDIDDYHQKIHETSPQYVCFSNSMIFESLIFLGGMIIILILSQCSENYLDKSHVYDTDIKALANQTP